CVRRRRLRKMDPEEDLLVAVTTQPVERVRDGRLSGSAAGGGHPPLSVRLRDTVRGDEIGRCPAEGLEALREARAQSKRDERGKAGGVIAGLGEKRRKSRLLAGEAVEPLDHRCVAARRDPGEDRGERG